MMEYNHDAALIERLRSDDLEAFNEIFGRFKQPLYYFARKLIKEDEQAKDIVADTFRKFWERRAYFESLANIKAFLYITARNSCIDYFRLSKKQKEAEKELTGHVDISEEGIINKIVETEILEEIYNKIKDLPEKAREIVYLHYEKGLSLKEIAEKLNISQEDARVTKFRTLDLLRKHLNPKLLLSVLVALNLVSQ